MKYSKPLSNLIDPQSVQKIGELIENSSQILITTHLSPDGDALGSSLALFHYLKRIGKRVKLMVPNKFPYFLKWLNGSDEILIYEYNQEGAKTIFNHSDLIFSLDYNVPKRIGAMGLLLENSTAKKILIDHHLFPCDIFDVTVSCPQMSSTSELIFRYFYQADLYDQLTTTEAECIYCGMMTDTGGFTYNSNDAEIYQIISLLLLKDIDKDQIYSNVFHNMSEGRFRLLGFALSQRMKVYPELNSALIWLSKEDQNQFEYSKGDTEGFVNYPLNIKDIVFATFIREDDDLIKMSFRSQGGFECNEFASKYFNGGGHQNASGGEFHGDINDAISLYEKGLNEYAQIIKNSLK